MAVCGRGTHSQIRQQRYLVGWHMHHTTITADHEGDTVAAGQFACLLRGFAHGDVHLGGEINGAVLVQG